MKRINVLLLVTELNIGGAEKVVQQIATGLPLDRYRVLVACLYDPGPIAHDIRDAGVPVVDLQMRGKWDARVVHRLHRLLQHHRIDILHSHLIHANLLAAAVGRLGGTRIIITTRHNVYIGPIWREWFNRWLSPRRDAAVVISEEVRIAELERSKSDCDKVFLIPNGITVSRFREIDPAAMLSLREVWQIGPNDLAIGMLARFHEQKGHRHIIDAAKIILRKMPDTKVVLVGEGQLLPSMQARARRLGIAGSVIFPGIRRDVPEILGLLDLFVLPSLWEGLPISILEAMAARLPVVATRVGGVPEVVLDGVTGLLVPPRDPQALAGAIVRLLGDPELRRRMGQAGRERVREHFSVDQMVRRTEALYEELLKEKGLGPVTPGGV